ncbi:MAG TPA: arginase family protein, partial [Gaiellaceae bacterium]|nr:arginase family protein [Gaiellaceae bacterium]
LSSAAEAAYPADYGIDALTYEELASLGPGGFSDRARNRVGTGPCFLSFDIDFVDPAFAPGTGTPEVGGPSSRDALTYVRSLAGLDFRGFDCVEVSPPFDPAGVTAFVAANACFEMLSLLALRR